MSFRSFLVLVPQNKAGVIKLEFIKSHLWEATKVYLKINQYRKLPWNEFVCIVHFLVQPCVESSIVIGSLVGSWSPVWSRFLACVRRLEFRSRSVGTVVGRNASVFRVVWRGGRPKCHRRVYSANAVGACRYLLPFEHNAQTWQIL